MVKRTIALQVLSGVGAAALSFALAGPVAAEEKLNIVYTHHSSASNPFWQAVKKGFDDACAKIQANCQMVFTQTEGSVDQEVANQQAALARKPDALITTLVDNNAFVANLKDAKAKGVIVIASNVDATEGPELELRQAFVGQNFVPAGTTLGRRMAALFPKEGPIRVLVGVNAPGQNWSEQRGQGHHERARGVQEGQSEPRDHDRPSGRERQTAQSSAIASAPISAPTRTRRPISRPGSGIPTSRAC